jgi:ABC-type branched-subunit amino acid transport system ATPase component
MNDLILETSELTKEFKGFSRSQRVNLRVQRGHIHALIGPNGAGKTTCFNLLTKFLTPSAGRIVFDGQDITGERRRSIARRGVIRSFQISAVFPHLTVLENVRVALQRAAALVPLLAQRAHAGCAQRPRDGAARRRGPGQLCRREGGRAGLWPQARAGDRHHAGDGAEADAARRTDARAWAWKTWTASAS